MGQLRLIRADGTDLRQLTDIPGATFFPSVSPDGQTVLFTLSARGSGDGRIYTIHIDGTDPRLLAADNVGDAYWSPDGSRIAFIDNGCSPCPQSDLWTMRADGSDRVRLTRGNVNDNHPQWSPDGAWLTFTRVNYAVRSLTGSQIFRIRSDGTALQTVTTPNKGSYNFEATWGPQAP